MIETRPTKAVCTECVIYRSAACFASGRAERAVSRIIHKRNQIFCSTGLCIAIAGRIFQCRLPWLVEFQSLDAVTTVFGKKSPRKMMEWLLANCSIEKIRDNQERTLENLKREAEPSTKILINKMAADSRHDQLQEEQEEEGSR